MPFSKSTFSLPLKKSIPNNNTSNHNACNNNQSGKIQTEEEKQRSKKLYLTLLDHSANCLECGSNNCRKMKVETSYF